MTAPVALAWCITHSFHKLAQNMLSFYVFLGTPPVLLPPLLCWRRIQQNSCWSFRRLLCSCRSTCITVTFVLVLFKSCVNSSSNSFSVNSGRVGLEMQLVVGAHSCEINWSTFLSRKPCSSSISCVERFNKTVAVANDCEVTSVGIVVKVSVTII